VGGLRENSDPIDYEKLSWSLFLIYLLWTLILAILETVELLLCLPIE
jgi:hypothetical protein